MKTKNLILVSCLSSITLIGGVSGSQAQERAWWEFFFPVERNLPDPSKTLQAPFADPNAVVDDEKTLSTSGLPDNSTPLDQAHRTDAAISKWIEGAVAEMLAYKSVSFKDDYKVKAKSFDHAGLREYIKFLEDQKIWSALATGRYDMNAFVVDTPILLNEGSVAGRYRWLFQTRVMITYTGAGQKSYKDVSGGGVSTMEMQVNVQVGRAEGVNNEHGLLFEAWNGKVLSSPQ